MMNNQPEQTSNNKHSKDNKESKGLKFGDTDTQNPVASAAASFGETAQKITSDLGERLSTTGRDVTAWTKENPMKAALIGAGAGFVIGSVVRNIMRTKH